MNNEKIKGYLSGVGIVLVLGATAVTMFYPELIKLPNMEKYPYSYKEISVKNSALESSKNQLTRNEPMIPSKIEEKKQVEDSVTIAMEENERVKSQFDFENLTYHLPSVLVTLEQGALNAGIKEENYTIEFDMIKTNNDGEGMGGEYSDPSMPDGRPDGRPEGRPDDEDSRGETDPNMSTPEEPTPETPNPAAPVAEPGITPGVEGGDIAQELVNGDMKSVLAMDKVPMIPGISVTTVPIKASALTYHQAREYIKFLDDLDFVEPSFVDIYSEGDLVTIAVLVHIFHKEGGISYE